jgi:phosphatidylserine/phosphatidylglycerophosphate/cardiolipin synthase-like enzyme
MTAETTLGCEPIVAPTPTIATSLHRLRLLPDMRLLLDTFFGDVDRAVRRVDVECYIVNSDVLGRLLGIALVRAAKRGVRTRLLYDPIGSEKADPALFDELREGGVEVRAYRDKTSALFGKGSTFTRDHGRIMLVDDAAYTGGADSTERNTGIAFSISAGVPMEMRAQDVIGGNARPTATPCWRQASWKLRESRLISTKMKLASDCATR